MSFFLEKEKEKGRTEKGDRRTKEIGKSFEQSARSEMEARLARLEALMLETNPD